eukprot:scaffold54797_cov60-Phaeocystis_antarctica.AAC.3
MPTFAAASSQLKPQRLSPPPTVGTSSSGFFAVPSSFRVSFNQGGMVPADLSDFHTPTTYSPNSHFPGVFSSQKASSSPSDFRRCLCPKRTSSVSIVGERYLIVLPGLDSCSVLAATEDEEHRPGVGGARSAPSNACSPAW